MDASANFGGLLVAIEGIDGAGKSTLAAALVGRLRSFGCTVVASKEPTNGPHGQALRSSAATGRKSAAEELALFMADRREHVEQLIRPALDRGEVVILDRYYFSNMAYQGAAGLDIEHVRRLNEEFAPRPDLLLVLDLPVEEGLRRISARGDVANEFEQVEPLERARGIFRSIAAPSGNLIDASQSAADVEVEAERLVLRAIADKIARNGITEQAISQAAAVFGVRANVGVGGRN